MIIAGTHCLGPAARIRTKSIYSNIEARLRPVERGQHSYHIGWSCRVTILPEVRRDLQFWIQHILSLNGQPMAFPTARRTIDILINTDASGCGWGGSSFNLTPDAMCSFTSHIHLFLNFPTQYDDDFIELQRIHVCSSSPSISRIPS